MRYLTMTIPVLLALLVGLGCSLVTDFPEDLLDEDAGSTDDPGQEPYSLDTNIENPVDVTLLASGNASIILDFAEALPEANEGDVAVADLLGDTVDLTVKSLAAGGATVNLTQGDRVSGEPSAAGEYQLILADDRSSVEIIFRNMTKAPGLSLRTEGDYQALIDVKPNYFFAIEAFERDVAVSE